MSDHRSNARKAVGLLVKLSYTGVDEFAQRYATNLSDGGMFIRSRDPKPVGTELKFRVEIANGQRVMQGSAIVRWVRGPDDPAGAPGMGVQFVALDESSKVLVDRMLLSSQSAKPPAIAPAIAPATPAPRPPPIAPLVAPSIAPVSAKSAPVPPVAPKASAPAAAPTPIEDLFSSLEPTPGPEIEIDTSPPAENEIELDLDSLIASTPEAPPPVEEPLPSSPSQSFELDIDLDLSVPEAPPPPVAPPSAPPPVAPPPPALPEIRREVARPPEPQRTVPTVQTLVVQAAAPAPAPITTGPVYLTDVGPIADTGPVIGIDLGTTNSACAIVTKGRPLILRSKDGYNTIPSVVALSKNGRLEVGHRAKGQMVLNPTQSIFGAKRLVGRDFGSATVEHVRTRAHFEIVADSQNRAAVKLGGNTLMLEEVQGLILKECREMAEHTLGTKVSRAVVTCPAYYSEPQREAVRRAGAMAGLKVERVLNEPTAAALAFGMNRELARTVLVYDLGGGTFDATLLKIDKNVFEVLATGGDVFLGGVDFDNQLVDLLLQRFQTQHGRPFAGDQVALSRIAEVAEKAKVALSEQTTFDLHLPMLEMDASGTPRDLKCTITRADVELACRPLVERTIQAVQDVLLDARLKPSQVDDIILVGGMSRMPLVREQLKALFKKPPHASVNADEAVALGAALYSGSVDKVSSLVLIDVVPMTVGLGKPGGGFHRLIERNTPLPATKSFGLSTHLDNQTELEVLIFQGEDSNVAGNEFLGAMKIEGLPKGPKGSVQIAITVSLDAECVLKVEAREFRTRKVVQATLASRYTTDEVARRLGISAEKRAETNQKRSEELGQRAGGFWSRLKRVFSRS
ncbi:MAG: TIGR02266 family protein [Myxococcaceae bacterium]